MFRVFSYVKEPVQCLRQIPAGILHNPCRKQVSWQGWLAQSVLAKESFLRHLGEHCSTNISTPAAGAAACVRQMGTTLRAAPCFGNLLGEVVVLPKQKLERQLIMQAAISKS